MHWQRAAALAADWLDWSAGVGCFAGAAWLLRPGRLERVERAARRPAAERSIEWALAAAWPLLLCALKLAQYQSYQLMGDSAVFANTVYNAAQGRGLVCSLYGGLHALAFHFQLTALLFAPLARLWSSPAPLVVAHAAALGLCPWLVYKISRPAGAAPALGAALLTLANPMYADLAGNFLDCANFAPPFFLAAALLWSRGRRAAAALAALLLLTTREQAPFVLFGVCAWLALEARDVRARAAALAGAAGTVVLWLGEMRLIGSGGEGLAASQWGMFSRVGGSLTGVLRTLATRPWALAAALVWPPAKLWTALRVLGAFAFLPLAAGPALLPALAAWLPQQLADEHSFFHQMRGIYGAFVLGPMAWAAARGLCSLAPKRPRGLAAAVLSAAGLGLLQRGFHLLPAGELPAVWLDEGPAALASVPGAAAVWTDQFFAAHLAMRPCLKILPPDRDALFERGLFLPDRVLLSRRGLDFVAPAQRALLLRILEERRFAPVYRGRDLWVLANPETFGREGLRPPDGLRLDR
ncbi:MAG TPA: DUF2079 domain-containing protein [Elusimicrobiota bacterium]|nr:DUF2079 domain-containing protein [Elusimicrobiota bacterium]